MSDKLPACRGFRLWATQEDIDKLEACRTFSTRAIHVVGADARPTLGKIDVRREGRANWPLCLDSFNVVFREDQANCQFALPFSEEKTK